jgi:serine/threonine-protein phosphatase CPPED1
MNPGGIGLNLGADRLDKGAEPLPRGACTMKRLLISILAVNAILGALFISRLAPAGGIAPRKDLVVQVDKDANPWNHLKMNNAASTFRFAIVSDRTGGPRDGVWEKAMDQLNLLQPEFVMCVGDLIQGGTKDIDKVNREWKELNGWVGKLEMPFFYVPGNHDIGNEAMEKRWTEQFGRRWYHFIYKDVLFVTLDTEDQSAQGRSPKFGQEQITAVKKILAENANVRWTFVFFHRPLWNSNNLQQTGWLPIEEALQGRKYTVFVGHEHIYQRQVRFGMKYFTLATTGGVSKLRGAPMGEFDHIVWITMKNDGPVMTNLMMEGIFPEDFKLAPQAERAQMP